MFVFSSYSSLPLYQGDIRAMWHLDGLETRNHETMPTASSTELQQSGPRTDEGHVMTVVLPLQSLYGRAVSQ